VKAGILCRAVDDEILLVCRRHNVSVFFVSEKGEVSKAETSWEGCGHTLREYRKIQRKCQRNLEKY